MHEILIDDGIDRVDKKTLILSYLKDNCVSIEFQYLSDFKNTKHLRDFVDCVGNISGVSPIDLARLILVVDEMNNNAIEYGSIQGELNKMRIIMKNNESGLDVCIESEDTGNGVKHKNAQQMELLREEKRKEGFRNHHSIRGRGLFMIITHIVKELYFKDSDTGGLIVGVTLKLNSK